jgi:hypothetical protein
MTRARARARIALETGIAGVNRADLPVVQIRMSWPGAGLNLKATSAAEISGRDTGTHQTAAQCLRRVAK